MNAETTLLFKSDSYRIADFKCKSISGERSGTEYQARFSVSFIRSGNFVYNIFGNSLDAHTGRILLNKPGFEHTVDHLHCIPDRCTSVAFDGAFYERLKDRYRREAGWFFDDNDQHSILVDSDAGIEFLHNRLLASLNAKRYSTLLVDSLVHEILDSVMDRMSQRREPRRLPESLKRNHLETIERAKAYINENYSRDISLNEIACSSFVSPFHFSRIFKSFTSFSPHRYLIETRLKNAELLAKHTALPITEICFSSGFESLEYFSFAFRKKFGASPSGYRSEVAGRK